MFSKGLAVPRSVFLLAVHADAGIRAHDGTGSTADAGVSHFLAEGISLVVHLVLGKSERVCRTGHYAKRTPFAAVSVDDDSSFHLAHKEMI